MAGDNSSDLPDGQSKKQGAQATPPENRCHGQVYGVMLTVTRFVDVTVPFVPGADAVTLTVTGDTPVTEKA